jgi:hypothetical protein
MTSERHAPASQPGNGFIREMMDESSRPADQTVFRLDKGLTAGSVLDTIEQLQASYLPLVLSKPFSVFINSYHRRFDRSLLQLT